MTPEEQAALFEQKVQQLLAGRPNEMALVYLLFDNPKKALLGFSEDWVAAQMQVPEETVVQLIKTLRSMNIVKLGPTGLNFIINTNL